MKITKVKNEIKSLGLPELKQRADDLRRELFTLRLNASTTHIKDYSQINKLRRHVARVLTLMRQNRTSVI